MSEDPSAGAAARARGRLAERLRARRGEIEAAIFARISDRWFEQTGSGDPEYVAGLRAAGGAALDYILSGIERWGELLAPAPAQATEQARRAARVGVGLETVLRRYFAGHAVLDDFVMQEAERGVLRGRQATTRETLQIIATLVERLTAAVGGAYNEERERAGAGAVAGEAGAAGESGEAGGDGAASEDGAGRRRGGAGPRRAGPGGSPSSPGSTGTRRDGEGARRTGSGGSPAPPGRTSTRPRRATPEDGACRRDRILQAMIAVAAERGFERSSVKLVSERARVSTGTFYEEFGNLRDCFTACLDLALERTGGLVAQAFVHERRWQDGVLGTLASVLVFFDSEPLLTRVWFVEAVAAGSWALERREQIVQALRSLIVERWAALGDEPPEPVAAAAMMASVIGLIQTHLVTERPEPLIELLGPLMGLVASLHLEDAGERAREVGRGERLAREIRAGRAPEWILPPAPAVASASRSASEPSPNARAGDGPDVALPAKLANPSARRARECLLYLAGHPDASNGQIAAAIGIAHKSQISKLLSDLLAEGLAVKRSQGVGAPNAWRLTPSGEEVARALAEALGW